MTALMTTTLVQAIEKSRLAPNEVEEILLSYHPRNSALKLKLDAFAAALSAQKGHDDYSLNVPPKSSWPFITPDRFIEDILPSCIMSYDQLDKLLVILRCLLIRHPQLVRGVFNMLHLAGEGMPFRNFPHFRDLLNEYCTQRLYVITKMMKK